MNTQSDITFLMFKYKQENLDEDKIKNRLRNLDDMDDFIQFKESVKHQI